LTGRLDRHRAGRAAASLGLLLLAGSAAAGDAPATGEPPPPVAGGAGARPRICLALSGGGARGFAHIGALQALEELRVPVDCIAGTSMGSIVGGLYATGMSPREIEDAIGTVDWGNLFNDRPPRRDLSFRRKQDDVADLAEVEVGIKDGRIALPRGLIAGQKIGFVLESLTLRAAGVEDFDTLPIPFRAVATDIGTGSMVVLRRGKLADALRASMSLPGLVAPIEIDGRLLVDGGLVRNLPVDVAREMGADVVIAIDISTPLDPPSAIRSVTDVTRQVTGMLTHGNVEAQAAAADLLIRPDLAGATSGSFFQARAILPAGHEAILARRAALAPYALTEEAYTARNAALRAALKAPARIAAVRIDAPPDVDPRVLSRRIRTRPDSNLDLATLQSDLGRLYELGEFERVDFTLEPSGEGTDLVIRAREKPWGPRSLRFGVNFLNDFAGNTDFNVRARYTRLLADRLGAEWRTDAQIGRTRRVLTELYQPLEFSGTWFVAPSLDVSSAVVDIFEDDRRIADYDVHSASGAVALGAQLGRSGEARAGVLHGRARAHVGVGPSTLPRLDVSIGAWVGTLNFDRLDEAHFPHRGFAGGLGAFLARRGLGSDVAYDKLTGGASQFFTRGRNTVFMGLNGGANLGSAIPFYDEFGLGGLFSLSGFRRERSAASCSACPASVTTARPAVSPGRRAGPSISARGPRPATPGPARMKPASATCATPGRSASDSTRSWARSIWLTGEPTEATTPSTLRSVDQSEDRGFSASTTSSECDIDFRRTQSAKNDSQADGSPVRRKGRHVFLFPGAAIRGAPAVQIRALWTVPPVGKITPVCPFVDPLIFPKA